MKFIYAPVIFIVCCSIACKTAKPAAGALTAATAASTTGKKDHSYILALILKATRGKNQSIVFEVSSSLKKEGKLKPGQNDNSGNDFNISFANEQDEPLVTYHVKNPLDTWIESSGEPGKLETTQVKKDEEYIPLRTNYNPAMKKLVITRNAPDSNKIIIPLNIQ